MDTHGIVNAMKIGLISLGCPKNLVDSEVMLGLAREAGHELTQDAASADVLVVNTCAFIDSAKQESIDAILEMAQHKKDGACQRLIVTGCLAERYRDELRAEIPEIDAVLGTGEVPDIVERDRRSRSRPRRLAAHVLPTRRTRTERSAAHAPGTPAPGTIEPSTRSRHRERPTLHLRRRDAAPARHAAALRVSEDRRRLRLQVRVLHHPDAARRTTAAGPPTRSFARRGRWPARGVKELLLISQDTTFYGIDRHERGALARLLRELNTIDGLEWIRLLYLYPTTIDDDTLAAMAECDKVCNYIDLPLQHASNPVLKRMKRPGTRQSYDRLLDRIRDRVPGVALRTTFIVGFPGETEADVDELCAFVGDHAFDHVGVFTYSHEEGTSAHDLDRRRAGADEARAAEPGHEPAEAAGRRAQNARGSASGSACSSTARRATTSWC